MIVRASAPGKMVLLGEYVVLDGADALVIAINRRCRAELAMRRDGQCHLTTHMPDRSTRAFAAGQSSGSPLVDEIRRTPELAAPDCGWDADIDSAEFFQDGQKLGLGSSAAVLVAFAGATHHAAGNGDLPELGDLIDCHRRFQAGRGSGIDVAASLIGGAVEFRLNDRRQAETGSVRLPKSVAFAGVFAGGSASTPGLVGRYRQWADTGSARVAEVQRRLRTIAGEGCAAVRSDDGQGFVAAIAAYGQAPDALGREMGADLVTSEHRQIGGLAQSLGLAYKVSGAGGGDVGIACGLDQSALSEFSRRAQSDGFCVVPLQVDETGLVVEEHAE